MKEWQAKEMDAVVQPSHITIHKATLDWEANGLKCWEVIIGFSDGRLEWGHTYSATLAELGPHDVEFFKDKSSRRCIRLPRKDK